MNTFPGWLMTPDQRLLYFRLIDQAARAQGANTAAEKDAFRKLLHVRAFGRPVSAKEIDRLKMFDAIKAECLAILQPDNLSAQLAQATMETTRLIHAIEAAAPRPYWQKISRDRFGTDDLTQLRDPQLVQLRNTLHARRSPRQPAQQPAPQPAMATDSPF